MRRKLTAAVMRASALDAAGDRLQQMIQSVNRSQRLRDVLNGVPLGHPLHPALIQLPVGAWISAALLDAVPGRQRAARTLIAVGTVGALPAAVAGLADWSTLSREQRRTGLVHAGANSVALTLYAASLIARARGRHGAGKLLGYLGFSVAGMSAYLGGHLSYAQGAAVNQAEPDLNLLHQGEWYDLGPLTDFGPGEAVPAAVGDVPVLVYRDGSEVSVLLAHCAHQRGPLADGKVTTVDGDGAPCVICPWHGSTFRLRDGAVVHGPAASDQPTLRTRVVDGRLSVRSD